jgi:predicted O-methyltransferase YrrM
VIAELVRSKGQLNVDGGLADDASIRTIDTARRFPDFLSEVRNDRRLHSILADDLTLPLGQLPSEVDLLFVDTNHTYRQVSGEWERFKPLLAKGAIVLFDDIHLNADMERFWEELHEQKLDTGSLYHQSGLGLVV